MNKICLRDEGVPIEFEFVDDLTGLKSAKIIYKKPNKEIGEWECVINDNSIFYVTQEGDIDVVGIWELQPFLNFNDDDETGEFKGRGDIVKLQVLKILE